MAKKKNTLTLTLRFDLADGSDSFAQFCAALLKGGFEAEVRQMGEELLKEAERRNLPIAKKIREGVS